MALLELRTQVVGRPGRRPARLAARWGLSEAKNVEQTERDLKAVFPKDTWNARHLQIIYFGREYCPALRHDFAACPICSWAATNKVKRQKPSASGSSSSSSSTKSQRSRQSSQR